MAEVVQKIAAMTDYDQALTFNVGTIEGGTVVNRVPHAARIFVEMRTYDMAVFEAGIAGVSALAGSGSVTSGDGSFRCTVAVDVVHRTLPWPRNESTDALYAHWAAAGAELGIAVGPEARGGLSDGNHFWDAFPTLDGLGPSGGNAHCSERSVDGSKDQEYVLRDSFVPKALLNTTALLKLLATLLPIDEQ
jgi:glutamate carboxypeptidase